MKPQTVKRNRNTPPGKHSKQYSDERQLSTDEFNMLNFYMFLAYSCPFMPMVDLSFAIDELISMVKNWNERDQIV